MRLFGNASDGPKPPIAHGAIARAYEYQGAYLVCSVEGIAETNSITKLDATISAALLGETIIKHLMEHQPQSTRSHHADKASDWMAFKTSMAKSVRQFEENLWHVDLEVANWVIEIWARPRISLHAMASYSTAQILMPEMIGERVRRALRGAKALRASDLV